MKKLLLCAVAVFVLLISGCASDVDNRARAFGSLFGSVETLKQNDVKAGE